MPKLELRDQISNNPNVRVHGKVKQLTRRHNRGSEHSNPTITPSAPNIPKLDNGLADTKSSVHCKLADDLLSSSVSQDLRGTLKDQCSRLEKPTNQERLGKGVRPGILHTSTIPQNRMGLTGNSRTDNGMKEILLH